MAQGLIALESDLSGTAQRLGSSAVALENRRNSEIALQDAAEKGQTMNTISQGAGMGAAIGSVVPGVGTAAGFFIGALSGLAVDKLF